MLVTRYENASHANDYRVWMPMTTQYKNSKTGVWASVRPRFRVMYRHNYAQTENGHTITIPDWYTFPNWRRGAVSLNYGACVALDNPVSTSSDFTHAMSCNVAGWSNNTLTLNGFHWMTDRHSNIQSTNDVVTVYPKGTGYVTDNDYCSYSGAFSDAWLKDSSGNPIPELKHWKLVNPYYFQHPSSNLDNYLAISTQNSKETSNNFNPYAFRMNSSVLEGATSQYMYFPEMYILWSVDKPVNPAAFAIGIDGYRTAESTLYWNDIPSAKFRSSFHLRLQWLDSAMSRTVFHMAANGWHSDQETDGKITDVVISNRGNDDYGARMVNLGEFGGRYYMMGFISMLGGNSRVAVNQYNINNACTGFLTNVCPRNLYNYWYFTPPFLMFEGVRYDDTPTLMLPTFLPQGTNIRIHEYGMNFWGGNTTNLASSWGTNIGYGWKTKAFS